MVQYPAVFNLSPVNSTNSLYALLPSSRMGAAHTRVNITGRGTLQDNSVQFEVVAEAQSCSMDVRSPDVRQGMARALNCCICGLCV